MSDVLLLGPLLRHVDATSASVWVETRAAARVAVHAGGRTWEAGTFAVHGHHYALVEVEGLAPATTSPYSVAVDGHRVWPEPGSAYPPSVIATADPTTSPRLAFGSCRVSVGHDSAGTAAYGVDALRAYARRMATDASASWPDLLLLLGDQVYADETTAQMREFIASRRDVDRPPGTEVRDYEEYAHLYTLAWTEPVTRWLLSTLPSAMIFDDHDIRDDWNTSAAWREKMAATPWWHRRIVAGLSSYWVYQHLGNLSPEERRADPLWQVVLAGYDNGGGTDLTDTLDAFAAEADRHPDCYRWSHARDLGDVRLVVADSRAARVLTDGERSILDDSEMDWLDQQMQGGFRHLLVGTSLPYLLPPGLHHLEAFDEALGHGVWGRRCARWGEWLRQAMDLEHWAAFEDGFRRVAAMTLEVAEGRRGTAPDTITFLSGDVHNSYVAEVVSSRGRHSRILQAVCSPIRNPLPSRVRRVMRLLASPVATGIGASLARCAHVRGLPLRWRVVRGPWFDNNLATLEATPTGLSLRWEAGVDDGDPDHPTMRRVAAVRVDTDGSGSAALTPTRRVGGQRSRRLGTLVGWVSGRVGARRGRAGRSRRAR